MARTNIEEEAWARIYRLAELRGCSVREAAGTAACLWHQSQSLVKATGTHEEILEWASLHNIDEKESEKWISALKKAMLITQSDDGSFCIRGNEIQLKSMIGKISRAAKGGQALKKKLRDLKKLQAGLKPALRGLQEASRGSNQCNSMQFNSDQGNANQGNASQSNLIMAKKEKTGKKANAFLAAYAARFKVRWGDNPEFLPKHTGIAGRIAKGLSDEKIGLYLDAYFSMPDSWLVKTKHPIETFETKINEIVVFANSGTFTSRSEASKADASVALHSQLEKIRSGELI